LASAIGVLTLLRSGQAPADWAALDPRVQNLALYLIAAHHGKVRLSIRSMPDECKPQRQDQLFARGVWDGDDLPAMPLGGGITAPQVERLDLSPMKLGRGSDGSPSWAERMLLLRDHPDFGPLRLAYLEALLRAADMRASKKAEEKAQVKDA
jgi:CRISPR-associated endonuclease/helicase Cas3